MNNIKSITLKNWGASEEAREEVKNILQNNPNMRELGLCEGGFYSQKNASKKKIIVYAWYYRGEWSDKTKEEYTKLIEI